MKNLYTIISLYVASIFLISSSAQTPGDVCNDPIPYPGDVANSICVFTYDFSNFSSGDGPVGTCGFSDDVTAWFEFTAPVVTALGDPLYLDFDDGEGFVNDCDLGIQFYSTNCFTPVSNCLYFDDGIIGGLTQGTDYLILIWDIQGAGFSCDFCLTVAATPPPGNECDDAIPYTGDIINETCMTGFDFTGYSGSVTSPLISCGPIGDYSAWFTVTTPVTTAIGEPIDLFFDNGNGQSNDCDLSIEFYALDCNTPVSNCYIVNSGIISGLAQGTDYLMLIDNHIGEIICDFCLTLPPPPPPNNDCSGATPFPANISNSGCVSDFDFEGYTDSGLSPSPSCDAGDPNVWYTFTAPITSSAGDPLTLQWDAGFFCFVGIEIYEPDCMTPVSSCLNNDNGFLPGLIQGNDYYAVIWADGNNSFCDFCLFIPPQPIPGSACNDPIPYPGDIANNICIENFNFSDFNNLGPSPCGFLDTNTAWFTVTTPVTTAVGDSIDLTFEAQYNELSIQFYSIDCSTAIGNCVEYGGVITGLVQGTDYIMAVSQEAFPFGGGPMDFCVTTAPPPHPNDVCSGAIPYPGDVVNGICVNDYNFLIANSSDDSDIPSCAGADNTIWFSWSAPVITAPGDPVDLIFDSGYGQGDNCFLGIEFYENDCTTPVSNCLNNISNVITGLIQGEDYLMVVFDDSPGSSVCDFCLYVAPPPTQGDECDDSLPYPGDITNGTCATNIDFSNFTYTNDSPLIYCTFPYQTVWYTITTPVITASGDPIDLFFNAGSCDLGILVANANCINGIRCEQGSGTLTFLEQGRDYLISINNSASSSSEICDFCITLEEDACPIVSFTGLPANTSSSTPISLTGSPLGGTFSGNGVIFNAFNPSVSGPGIHNVSYTYDDGNGCFGTATQNILVFTIIYNFIDYNLGTITPKINTAPTPELLFLQNAYPVPLSKALQIEVHSPYNEDVALTIRTIEGKIMHQMKTSLFKGLNTLKIPVDLLPYGNYIVELKTGDNLIQLPVLK